jgi:hypothetical protein
MAKRIKIIDDDTEELVDTTEFQHKLLEFMKAIDWKLWELLKIEQARAAKEGLISPEEIPTNNTGIGPFNTGGISQIILDEDF